ncbi:MAG: coiled-coil [Microgenomates group bacterium GW2011_GWC1_44_37]|uniref:Uncharacterized protein n=1 Tax=Candidatus Collierbacteria bacterium GW2011_GWB2_44_22 TaxID=1618387 RepID=A0A0G1HXA7_9BACT|nr:MAG: hypothetical protein UW31_C0011G0009 [Candidatus Collierbacteria bacterium GW2011_GWA2_44_13]KKT51751.1 MAG: hypothetical protein UW44_C0008G0073 [Candidatus Collierbacteria bacterium GW2011_GWB2_44_22]KKT63653.1 MAG: hypothetical protein UW58_C0054G0003 [Candidatus Collierbacteria bacterium GW2011_GWC2_44_30]KKT68287.1 MAG: coiled-coil [Microgenomates group bacterium GW2011_GWC1_44_37]KKT88236.1 MAG: hypothetical protein UW88_C0013G0005 [Candidatus Collierbacteria bacterium GW2011_GWD2
MTQNDLMQIRGVVEDVLEEKLEQKLEEKLEQKLEEKLDRKLKPIKTQLKSMDKKINKLQSGQNIILKYVDDQDTRIEKRVSRIENHLHLPSLRAL